jgi:exodeoxyribonuclease VII small subunit
MQNYRFLCFTASFSTFGQRILLKIMGKKLTYNEALVEMEQIVQNIEENKYSIDELSVKVKRISFLVNYCKEKLRNTEEELNKILKEEK